MHFLKLASLVTSLLVLSSCGGGGSGNSTSSNTSNVIGPTGGSVTSADSKATIQVPAGALSTNTAITVAPASGDVPLGNIGAVLDLGPNGTTFSTPVTITVKYDPNLIPQGVAESSLTLAYAAGTNWNDIPTTVDTVNKLLIGQTTHFTLYSQKTSDANKLPYGTLIGSTPNGVNVYSDGCVDPSDASNPKCMAINHQIIQDSHNIDSQTNFNYGLKWQCVEFINRYYKQIYDKDITVKGGNAKDYWTLASDKGLDKYANGPNNAPDGSTSPPQVGDIIVSQGNPVGHVAIVKQIDSKGVHVAQQNWDEGPFDQDYVLTINLASNTVNGFSAGYQVTGWLRLPTPITTSTIGGTITGLTGSVVLQNNGGDNFTVSAPGAFTFPTALANGSPYSVSVLTQPYGQVCSVSTGAGTVSGSNVTNVAVVCATNTYSVGGTVSGLVGSLVLQDNNGDNRTVSASGAFTFATQVANGSQYSVSVLTQPTSQNCSVANGTGTISLSNVTNVTITCATNTYTIGGTATGLSGSAVLQDNGVDNLTVSTSGTFTFPVAIANGSPYSVSVLTQPSGQTCSVSTGAGTVSGNNITSVGLVCTANTYSVGGTVSGLSGTLVLQDNAGDNRTVSASGAFTFATKIANGNQYSVSVLTQPSGQTCSVSTGAGTISLSNVTNVSVVCSTNTYSVGGTVSGLSGSLVLQDNAGDNRTVSASGAFTFATQVANGSSYNVTVFTQPSGQNCSVANGTGTMSSANVSNVNVTCATNTYTIGGTVTGLSGNVVLQDNGGDNKTISASGSFSFPTTVGYGNPYSVTVLTQPSGQTCVVTGGNGTATANVTSVGVNCVNSTLAPTVLSLPATLITSTTAQLNGSVNPNGLSTSSYFQYGTTTSYGSTVSMPTISGTAVIPVYTSGWTGSPNTTYHYRVVATNSLGTVYGSDITFTTANIVSNLNDTGITASQCYQAGSDVLVACNSAGAIALNNAQDGMVGRDANSATNSNVDGLLGFSFTAVTGGCVLDNVTGLMWEVKTNDGGLRDWNKTYTNYSATYNPSNSYGTATDTSGFVTAVNATNLCGHSDWRLPTADELQSIVDYGVAYPGPTIDTTWFPNTQGSLFWSASPYVGVSSNAWFVYFYDGYVNVYYRSNDYYVRLVRAGQ